MEVLPDLKNFGIGIFGNQADALRGLNIEMPAKTAGEIENVNIIEGYAVVLEQNFGAGNVRALGLREFVDIAFADILDRRWSAFARARICASSWFDSGRGS